MSAPADAAVQTEACARGKLPSLAVIESALIKVTERLAVELTTPSPRPPMWSALEWQIAEAVAALQGLSSPWPTSCAGGDRLAGSASCRNSVINACCGTASSARCSHRSMRPHVWLVSAS